MIRLFFDIETLPCEEEKRELILEILKKKRNKRKVSDDTSDITDEILHHGTGLDGAFGRICCIGYIKEDGFISKGVICGEEKEVLKQFWELVQDVNVFIGHNAYDFDLPFIYKRSIILGIKPTKDVNFARYRHDSIYDTMKEWDKWGFGNSISLDTLAKILDLPTSKDEMNGSEVWEYFKQGKVDEICKYCMKDVELTRQVYYKMTFEQPPEEFPKFEEELF